MKSRVPPPASSGIGFSRDGASQWIFLSALLISVLVGISGCSSKQKSASRSVSRQSGSPARTLGSAFSSEGLSRIEATIQEAIQNGRCPGGVLLLEHQGATYAKAFGMQALEPTPLPARISSVYDLASLTKVIATTPAILQLMEKGLLELDSPVGRYLPTFSGAARDRITVRQLLTHTSGLRPGLKWEGDATGSEAALQLACREIPQSIPGTKFVYSDINFILLGELVRQVSGLNLDEYCRIHLFEPLGMKETFFRRRGSPLPVSVSRISPTERLPQGGVIHGDVHDPTARRMGGVAGHAGLFSTGPDLARFARMMLGRGILEGRRVLQEDSILLATQIQSPDTVSAWRGLGWDIDSPYSGPRGQLFPMGSYGHTGWTGTSIWLDPFTRTFVIFLSNRNHPTEDGNVLGLRRELGTLAASAIPAIQWNRLPGSLPRRPASVFESKPAPGSTLNGIDVLTRDQFARLKNRKVGLITNHTGRNRDGVPTIDLLAAAPEVQLIALFSPEHGIRGAEDTQVGDGRDSKTGLPIYSLYGRFREPQPGQLVGIDTLVFDIQDIGCRFYTYISTLANSMEVANRLGLSFVVLDRNNPITGTSVSGPILAEPRSFVATHEIPVRHGMTVGEIAHLIRLDRQLDLDLSVVPCEGWTRGQWADSTGIPWVNPSPNMRSLAAATLYPGVGLIEFCHVSVGRGTPTPFEVVGAPWIDSSALLNALNRESLPGIRFAPVTFTPTASKFTNSPCHGVRFDVTDRERFDPVPLGIALALELHRQGQDKFNLSAMLPLLGDRSTLEGIRQGKHVSEIVESWKPRQEEFRKRRQRCLLY